MSSSKYSPSNSSLYTQNPEQIIFLINYEASKYVFVQDGQKCIYIVTELSIETALAYLHFP